MSPDQPTPTDAPAMSASELEAERKRGRWAGIAALVSILLIAAGAIWSSQIDQDDTGGKPVIARQQVTAQSKNRQAPLTAKQKKEQQKAKQDLADDRDEVNGLASIDNNLGTFFGAALLNALAFALLAFPARALYRATKSRNPNEASVIGFLAGYGPLALGIGTLVRAFALKHTSADFVDQQFATVAAAADEARDLQTGTGYVLFQALMGSGALAFAFWLIKGVWDASKIGLLPKPYAVLGMALPILTLIATPLAPPIAMFWMLALGLLLLGRWPSGIPPAWEAGRAIPWPPRGQAKTPPEPEAGGERNGTVKAVGPGVAEAGETEEDDAEGQGGADRPPQPRRKRKRRN